MTNVSANPRFMVHFTSPARDPLKVPRPVTFTVGKDATSHYGGEYIGTPIGFTLAPEGPDDFGDLGQWVAPEQLTPEVAESITGWFICYQDEGSIYTITDFKVERVEVLG